MIIKREQYISELLGKRWNGNVKIIIHKFPIQHVFLLSQSVS